MNQQLNGGNEVAELQARLFESLLLSNISQAESTINARLSRIGSVFQCRDNEIHSRSVSQDFFRAVCAFRGW
ncbi:hypothetical protein [Gimesia panareensis]|uniref:hypothetical protein n=1 Tax=Gimesia panareensis TaxID=2527978 RepID=UPI0011A656B6|nr:hypothetical protein [Gimesia panareensis]